jgi:hypothetical protein
LLSLNFQNIDYSTELVDSKLENLRTNFDQAWHKSDFENLSKNVLIVREAKHKVMEHLNQNSFDLFDKETTESFIHFVIYFDIKKFFINLCVIA